MEPADQERLIQEYGSLVHQIAFHLLRRFPPSVDVDDLIQAGMLGLIEASRRYDSSQGAAFKTYAGIRIRGAMLDEVRKTDWAPRSVHRTARIFSESRSALEQKFGRPATHSEAAEAMGMPLAEYHDLLADASRGRICFFEDLTGTKSDSWEVQGHENDPLDEMLRQKEAKDLLLAVLLYDYHELKLHEVGVILGVTESRACQIHCQALLRMRRLLYEKMQNEFRPCAAQTGVSHRLIETTSDGASREPESLARLARTTLG